MIRAACCALTGVVTAMALPCGSCASSAQPQSDAGPSGDLAQAAVDYPTFQALHAKIVMQTCAPVSGACHNSKQFPDLHTPETMLATINARCNALTSDPTQIQDLCEPKGDLLVVKSGPDQGWQTRVGFVSEHASPDSPAILVTLHEAAPHDAANVQASIVRDVDPKNIREIPLGTALTTMAGQAQATISLAEVWPVLAPFFLSPYTPGLPAQIIQGDPNRNGIFGADLGGALVKPGAPDKSFVVQRILGVVAPQMPLANGNLSSEQIDAIQCWVYQLAVDGSNADGPIDYAKCPGSFPQPVQSPGP